LYQAWVATSRLAKDFQQIKKAAHVLARFKTSNRCLRQRKKQRFQQLDI
jgi:hypothetical protein